MIDWRNVMRSVFANARWLADIFRHRREARILAGLDAHMLADMGLTRADLRDAFAEPLWRDPTRVLETRANERKRRSDHSAVTLVPDRVPIECRTADRPARLHL
jgi:uncharacterized protein YjiS (DUF1127 family)